jgi:hypothetical protein
LKAFENKELFLKKGITSASLAKNIKNEELLIINGGDGFWYDVAYVIEAIVSAAANAIVAAADTIASHPVGGPRGGYN